MEKLMSVAQVAEFLGLCQKTIWTLTHVKKELPFVRIGRSVRYSPTHLRAWIERRAQEHNP